MHNYDKTFVERTVVTDVFNLMPGLVIEVAGMPGVVTEVTRDIDTEKITFKVNTPEGDVEFTRSWAKGHCVRLIGIAVSLDVDAISLFDA